MVLSWSGGKDSALALWVLREESRTPPVALLTTVTEEYQRVSMHGVRRALLRCQAEAIGLLLLEAAIPPECSMRCTRLGLAGRLLRCGCEAWKRSPSAICSWKTSVPTGRA